MNLMGFNVHLNWLKKKNNDIYNIRRRIYTRRATYTIKIECWTNNNKIRFYYSHSNVNNHCRNAIHIIFNTGKNILLFFTFSALKCISVLHYTSIYRDVVLYLSDKRHVNGNRKKCYLYLNVRVEIKTIPTWVRIVIIIFC